MKRLVARGLLERRQHARFQVAGLNPCVVLTERWPGCAMKGNIADIGMGGVSFQYVARQREAHKASKLDILLVDEGVHLAGVPIETVVSDFQIHTGGPSRFGTRRCAVKFGDLTASQNSALRHFIQFHTTADAEA